MMRIHDTDGIPEEWLNPTQLLFIPHTCGNCKYDTVPEKDPPCVNCIHSIDMRKDLWEPKGE